jgi:hypothetical protein
LLPDELKGVDHYFSYKSLLNFLKIAKSELEEFKSQTIIQLIAKEYLHFEALKNNSLTIEEAEIEKRCKDMLLKINRWSPNSAQGEFIKKIASKKIKDLWHYNVYGVTNLPEKMTDEIAIARIEEERKKLEDRIGQLTKDLNLFPKKEALFKRVSIGA